MTVQQQVQQHCIWQMQQQVQQCPHLVRHLCKSVTAIKGMNVRTDQEIAQHYKLPKKHVIKSGGARQQRQE
jgi:hypothetical protein